MFVQQNVQSSFFPPMIEFFRQVPFEVRKILTVVPVAPPAYKIVLQVSTMVRLASPVIFSQRKLLKRHEERGVEAVIVLSVPKCNSVPVPAENMYM